MSPTTYATAQETLKRVLQMPEPERRAVLNMMRGAAAISELYTAQDRKERQEKEPA